MVISQDLEPLKCGSTVAIIAVSVMLIYITQQFVRRKYLKIIKLYGSSLLNFMHKQTHHMLDLFYFYS